MKKIAVIVIALLISTALFTSCASGSSSSYGYDNGAPAMSAAPAEDGGYYEADREEPAAPGDAEPLPDGSMTSGTIGTTIAGDKIIYNLSAQIESTKFDDSLKDLQMLLGRYSAFLESSYVSGNSYGNTTYRYADYTIRVPVQNFTGLQESLSQLGNVTSRNMTSQNITAQFIDTQSRLDTYRTEESRLLAILEKATTVEDMITIESRLSDIRYQIESLTSTLQNWQNQVDFSTVTLHISEVEELTDQKPIQRTYWQRMQDGLQSTLEGIGDFFKSFFMILVVILPVLLILAVIAVVVIIIVRIANKRRREKMAQAGPPPMNPTNPMNQPGPYQPGQFQNNPPNQNNDNKE